MSEEQTAKTLEALAEQRRSQDRPTHVHVVGDFSARPPKGASTARRVARLLAGEGGDVREGDYADLSDGDVAYVRIDEPQRRSQEQRQELRQLAHVSRANSLAGIVVFAETVSAALEQVLDARVRAEFGGVYRVERLQTNPYENEVIAVELDGLVSTDAE